MGITWTQTSTLPVLCAPVSTPKLAHPTMVGFLAVRGAKDRASLINGGLPQHEQPRTTTSTVRILPIMGAYGTGVSALQGSQKPDAAASAGVKASGVPPRGRPV